MQCRIGDGGVAKDALASYLTYAATAVWCYQLASRASASMQVLVRECTRVSHQRRRRRARGAQTRLRALAKTSCHILIREQKHTRTGTRAQKALEHIPARASSCACLRHRDGDGDADDNKALLALVPSGYVPSCAREMHLGNEREREQKSINHIRSARAR